MMLESEDGTAAISWDTNQARVDSEGLKRLMNRQWLCYYVVVL